MAPLVTVAANYSSLWVLLLLHIVTPIFIFGGGVGALFWYVAYCFVPFISLSSREIVALSVAFLACLCSC